MKGDSWKWAEDGKEANRTTEESKQPRPIAESVGLSTDAALLFLDTSLGVNRGSISSKTGTGKVKPQVSVAKWKCCTRHEYHGSKKPAQS